jgi:hypothetical protein
MKSFIVAFFCFMLVGILQAQQSIVGRWKQTEFCVIDKTTKKKESKPEYFSPCLILDISSTGVYKMDSKDCNANLKKTFKPSSGSKWAQTGTKVTFTDGGKGIPPASCIVSLSSNKMTLEYPQSISVYQKL